VALTCADIAEHDGRMTVAWPRMTAVWRWSIIAMIRP